MGVRGLSLVELAMVLVLLGVLGLALSTLFLSGVRTQGEASSLQAQALAQDLRDRLGQELRGVTPTGIVAVSGQSPTAGGFIAEVQYAGSPVCVQYRLGPTQALERRQWTGSCTSPTGVFQNLLAPALLPFAAFCYDDPSDPRTVGFMDAPCDLASLAGKGLTLRVGGKDHRFPPLVVALRSG